MSLSVEVKMRAEYNIKEKRRLASIFKEKNQLLKSRDEEIENLKAQLLLNEVKAAEAIRLCVEASHFEVAEKSLRDEVNTLNGCNTILEKERNALDVKVTDLEATVASKERELTDSNAQLTRIKSQNDDLTDQERFYPHLLTTISRRRWHLTHGMELVISKCLNSTKYLSALETPVSKAIKKGLQDGLAAGITHGMEGRALTDLKTNKDASIEDLMNVMRFEEHLAKRLGLHESQPHADQLMVPIHNSPDKTIVGASVLSLALDVSDARIEGTFDGVPATADITTALFVILASAGTVTPLFVDDYGVMGMDDQSVMNENFVIKDANPFPNVDDAEVNIPQ
uniref:Transposase (Putative), gypsy type n=1 Tax=Tanacetum cinerariifolium TaxID=118510 RepID=A0A699IJM9_TANCI|nr:hypothetical protein [Tanacetum cinerariifolium]